MRLTILFYSRDIGVKVVKLLNFGVMSLFSYQQMQSIGVAAAPPLNPPLVGGNSLESATCHQHIRICIYIGLYGTYMAHMAYYVL